MDKCRLNAGLIMCRATGQAITEALTKQKKCLGNKQKVNGSMRVVHQLKRRRANIKNINKKVIIKIT